MFLRSQIFLSRLNGIFHLKIVISQSTIQSRYVFFLMEHKQFQKRYVVKGTSTHSGNLKMGPE